MTNQQREERPHVLSVVAARVVSRSADKPGAWDFEKAFRPFIRLMDLRSRAEENEFSATSAATIEMRILWLLKRGLDLQNEILEVEKEIAKLL